MSGTILGSGDIAVSKTDQENLVLKSSHSSVYKGWQKLHNEQRLQTQNLKMVVSKAMWYCHSNKINRLTVSVQNHTLRNLVYVKMAFQINRQREKDNIFIKPS